MIERWFIKSGDIGLNIKELTERSATVYGEPREIFERI